jgi:hypothetical protein
MRYKTLTFLIAICLASTLTAKQTSKIVFEYQLKIIKEKNIFKNYKYSDLFMLHDKKFILYDTYKNKAKISIYNSSLKLLKSKFLSSKLIDTRNSFSLTPLRNGGFILQTYKRNRKYKKSGNETFLFKRLLHFDQDLNLITNVDVPTMGNILTHLTNKQKFYYFWGYGEKPLFKNPKLVNNYLLKINRNGEIIKRIKMKKKVLNFMISHIQPNGFSVYKNNQYVCASYI